MSITAGAIAKKAAVILAKDKRTWKVVGFLAAMIIVIALLPVMVLLAIGNQLSSAQTQNIDYSAYVQNLSAEQRQYRCGNRRALPLFKQSDCY